jgi:hypothetical protein
LEEDEMKSLVSASCLIALCCVLALAQGAHKKAAAGTATPMSDQQFVDFAGPNHSPRAL